MNGIPRKTQVWIAAVLCVGWVVLLGLFIARANWPLVVMSVLLLAVYGYRLYNLTRRK